MTVLQNIASNTPRGVVVAETPKTLAKIHRTDCAAAIWHRQSLSSFQSWLDGLGPEALPRGRLILRADAVQEAMGHLCDCAGTPAGPERDMLVDDIAALSAIFATVMEAEYLRLRLDVVSTNACRKFHVDAVSARLICTYRGTGTEYVGGHAQPIHTVPTCAPIVLRGSLWASETPVGLLHRSPPIEGTGETRLVLVLDPVADLEGTPKDRPTTRH